MPNHSKSKVLIKENERKEQVKPNKPSVVKWFVKGVHEIRQVWHEKPFDFFNALIAFASFFIAFMAFQKATDVKDFDVLLQKTSNTNSLLSEQLGDLTRYRRLEEKANFNKVNVALNDMNVFASRLSINRRMGGYSDGLKVYVDPIIGLCYQQVTNPYLLSQDSLYALWNKVHSQATMASRLWEYNDTTNTIESGLLRKGVKEMQEIKLEHIDSLLGDVSDLEIYFHQNMKSIK